MSIELATAYAALICHDDNLETTSERLVSLTAAAGVQIQPIYATIFAKALEGQDIKEFLFNLSSGAGASAGPSTGAATEAAAVEEKVEEEEEESSDDGMGFGLFD